MKTNVKTQNENLTFIKLKDLFLSVYNVRTVPASKQEDKLLKASIKSQGITQNLIVVPHKKQYAVIGGGRRLTQLNALLEEGEIKPDYLVPCLIESEENISALSLAENIKATMHPADEFMAFQSMIDEGKTIIQVSNEFGIPQTQIKKRLKMAGVAPELIAHYREGHIDLDAIMALTVSNDHDKQLACYRDLGTHGMRKWNIKRYLLESAVPTSDGKVKLVTLKAYKKAGGCVVSDLFESTSYISDRELLEKLALEILNDKADKLRKQWKWVEVSLTGAFSDYQGRLHAEFIDVPEKLSIALKEKHSALDTLNEKDYNDWTEADQTQEDALERKIDELETKREKYRQFTEEQKAVSGAVVSLNEQGEIVIQEGYVKKADMALAFPENQQELSGGVGEQSNGIESNALKRDLDNFKLQAVQAQVMKNDKLTYDLMVFSLAKAVFGQSGYFSRVLNMDIELSDFSQTNGFDETTSFEAIEAFKETLELSWLSQESDTERLSAFRALSNVQKKKLLSFSVAQSYLAPQDINSVVCDAINFDLSEHWKPTNENYFNRIKVADLIEIGRTQIGEQWANNAAKLPKKKLVEHLSTHKDIADWMPESMKS